MWRYRAFSASTYGCALKIADRCSRKWLIVGKAFSGVVVSFLGVPLIILRNGVYYLLSAAPMIS